MDAKPLGKDGRGRELWRIVFDDGTSQIIKTSKKSVDLMDQITKEHGAMLRRLAEK